MRKYGTRLLRDTRITVLLVMILLLSGAMGTVAAPQPRWEPQVSIVWPHDEQGNQTSAGHAQAVNVGVWPRNQVSCTGIPSLPLMLAKDNEPAEPVATGQLVSRTINGVTFPTFVYNNIPTNLTENPSAKYQFFTKWWSDQWIRGTGTTSPILHPEQIGPVSTSNVWVHATDPRTFLPQPVVPTGMNQDTITHVDTRIQVVWPHDESGHYAPVEEATRVNIAVDIFSHNTLLSVPADYFLDQDPPIVEGPYLYLAEENNPLSTPAYYSKNVGGLVTYKAAQITVSVHGEDYPRWVFNDVPVQPGKAYHFVVLVYGVENSPTVWTHAQDARTIFPVPQVPPACQ